MKKALVLILALIMLALALLPFFTKPEVLATFPPGYEPSYVARVEFEYLSRQEVVYYPDGTPADFRDYPIDRTQFPILVVLGPYEVRIHDSWQDAEGTWLKISYKGVFGTLRVFDGKSEGVELEPGVKLYITDAGLPERSGDWRRADGSYFYGFRWVELTVVE